MRVSLGRGAVSNFHSEPNDVIAFGFTFPVEVVLAILFLWSEEEREDCCSEI